ncbi:hypothetical protein STEG23_017575, partial [Scotinomys teguina]
PDLLSRNGTAQRRLDPPESISNRTNGQQYSRGHCDGGSSSTEITSSQIHQVGIQTELIHKRLT